MESHLLQMRGLKPLLRILRIYLKSSHLLQMRGLKPGKAFNPDGALCRIFYRCVD